MIDIFIILTFFLLVGILSYKIRILKKNRFPRGVRFLFIFFNLLLAIVVCKWLVYEPFIIPSNSMENTFFPGDIILANKLVYKINRIKQGDIIVFQAWDNNYLIKRCVAGPGNRIELRAGEVYNNDTQYPAMLTMKKMCRICLLTNRGFYNQIDSAGITSDITPDSNLCYIGNLSKSEMIKIKAFKQVSSIDKILYPAQKSAFLSRISQMWTIDRLGPLIVPAKNMMITLDNTSYSMYQDIIRHEGMILRKVKSQFYINGRSSKTYRFLYNYYFVLGDNRDNSLDSRFIGFIPEGSIVGRVNLVLVSNSSLKDSRLLKTVK